MNHRASGAVEWPTLFLIVACYLAWGLAISLLPSLWLPAAIALTTLAMTLFSSLQHEVLHGHPFRHRLLNEALMFLPIGLCFPYGRFRDTHLAHHRDEHLTDPYDDPESNFQDPAVWARLPGPVRLILTFNNTLLGRMIVGPVISSVIFYAGDLRAIAAGNRAILRDWILHFVGLILLVQVLQAAPMPGWAYLLSAYLALSVLKIRTFLEHRAHDLARARTVIIDGGHILPFLFLNNNLHVVHHARPGVPWYRLPALYRSQREEYLRRNEAYHYASYAEIFRRYFLKPKDPVPHPLRPGGQ